MKGFFFSPNDNYKMGYCENNATLSTNMPAIIMIRVYNDRGELEEERPLAFKVNNDRPQHGIYYFNQNGRLVPSRDLIDSVDV